MATEVDLAESMRRINELHSKLDRGTTDYDHVKVLPHPIPGATYADYSRVRKCPIWALVHRLEGKTLGVSDRCNPGCVLYMGEAGDCVFIVIANRLGGTDGAVE